MTELDTVPLTRAFYVLAACTFFYINSKISTMFLVIKYANVSVLSKCQKAVLKDHHSCRFDFQDSLFAQCLVCYQCVINV